MLANLKQFWRRLGSGVESAQESMELDPSPFAFWLKACAGILGIYLLIITILGLIWNSEPEVFAIKMASSIAVEGQDPPRPIVGVATTTTLIRVVETLLDKPGGYLTNDLTPPGAWMDNIPNWEYGVLVQVRDLARVLRESYSRSQSQSLEDPALKDAEAQFNFKRNSWILPSTEAEYRRGVGFISDYHARLMDSDEQNAQFYARADNLRFWLGTVETRLGDLSQKLSASVGQRRLNTDLSGDVAARQSTEGPTEYQIKTRWSRLDDVFYEARGASWALLHFLRAAEVDFADVLANKNALTSFEQVIRELERAQEPLMSPMVLNGSGFGLLANHSLVMASYISRANAALIDLRELLARG
jgi:hypothetical protein